nr:MAG: putative capsid protein [Canine stool-associated circular virus]
MTTYKRKPTRKPTTKKAFVKKAVAKAKTKRLATFVKKVIAKTEEVKFASYTGIVGVSAYTNTTNRQNNIIPLTPYAVTGITIPQGTGQNDRIGNRIRTKSVWLRGIIYPRPYGANNSNPTPQEVRVWFFSPKATTFQPTTLPGFFQGANNNSAAPGGTILDLTQIINNDAYIYRGHRTFKIGLSNMNAQAGVPSTVMGFTNNDFKFNARFNINLTKMIPKIIKYNDTDNTPFSTSVFMYWETVDADGSSQATDQAPIELSYSTTFRYTDV